MDRAKTRTPTRVPRLFLSLTTALVLLGMGFARVRPAAASTEWCWDDPVISVNDQIMSITAGVHGSAASVGAAHVMANIVVYVPAGTTTAILMPPPTDGPLVESLTIVTRGTWQPGTPISVTIQTTFTSTTRLAAAMQVTLPSGLTQQYTGTSRGTLTASFSE